MFDSQSIAVRFLVSVGANAFRSLLSFVTGLLIARGLAPASYGDLTFLMGSFVAIRAAMDMGTSNAYFTFLSQRIRPLKFHLVYFCWQAMQFIFTLGMVTFILPSSIFEKIWLENSREIVVLAFLAAFMQQQVWQTVSHIGEAERKTIKIQLMNIGVAVFYFAAVLAILEEEIMTVENVLVLLIFQYIGATIFAYWILRERKTGPIEADLSLGELGREYWKYCRPLILVSLIGFLYDFFDKWLLQKFGGSSQQGYFQVANQIAAISLLATTSILKIFWKEIAAAWSEADFKRVATLYHKVSRGLVTLSAIITGFLVPWSRQIVLTFLGPAYEDSWPVLAIMLLYPIHQSLGQVGGTMLLASGHTNKNLGLAIFFSLVAVPVSYLALAPHSGVLVPGLGLGAVGMAAKMVLLAMISANVQAWVIARYNGWSFDWKYQMFGIPLMLGLGYLANTIVSFSWELDKSNINELIMPFGIAGIIYTAFVLSVLLIFPWLIGSTRSDLRRLATVRP